MQRRQARWSRLIVWAFALWVFWAGLAVCAQQPQAAPEAAAPEAAAPAADLWVFIKEIFSNLFNSRALMETLGKPQYAIMAFIALNVIVFTETGLLIGFFLPGDSLLVTAGLIASHPLCGWNVPLLLTTLSVSAIVGDSVGYWIGARSGPRIFNREESWMFHRDHLLKAQQFYEKHGGKTIILARFMPIIRTFAPVVAGVGAMSYPRFALFNIVGGIGWVFSMVLTGYFLPALLNPVLEPVFGEGFKVQDHVEKVVIVVVLVSISPGIYIWLRNKYGSKPAAAPQPELAQAGK